MSYNVFVDHPGWGSNLATYNLERAYDASAVANHAVDLGFHVETDLWGDVVEDAMVSPQVWKRCGLGWMDNPIPK